jgi:glycosyltransferase involved in cell wall biosynthesis
MFRPVRDYRPANAISRFLKNLGILADYVWNWLALWRMVLRTRPRILHFQATMVPSLDTFVIPLFRLAGVKLVLTVHNLLPHDRGQRDPAVYERLYRRFDHLIVHSHENRESLRHFLKESPEPDISDFVHPAFRFLQQPINKQQVRQHLKLPLDAEIVLFFGMIRPYKGLDLLIKAFARISRNRERALLAIVGNCEDFAPYQASIDALGLSKKIVKKIDYIAEEEAALWLAASDIVALAHREIFQSGVASAALGAGRPMVAPRLGGLPEVVRDGQNGRLFTPGNCDELAAAIDELFSSPDTLDRMAAKSAEMAAGEFSWKKSAEEHLRVYGQLKAKGPSV